MADATWEQDLLGDGFEFGTLPLGSDDEGELVATIVRHTPHPVADLTGPLRDIDVLAVHGWSDYFFNPALAQFWTGHGARFFALDLRKYGRSIRDGQTLGDIADLDDYDADIEAALRAMGHAPGQGSTRKLVLLGHSTGGLTLSLWADRHRGRAEAIILNSPWLEFQTGPTGRKVLAPLVDARARVDPEGAHPNVDFGFYTKAQEKLGAIPTPEYRWDWRPRKGFPTHPAWLSAVLDGHQKVAAGIEVGAPTLVLLSAESASPFQWSDDMVAADSVLVVDDIARAATGLGAEVTIDRIDGAIHDVFLSAPAARDAAYAAVLAWIQAVTK